MDIRKMRLNTLMTQKEFSQKFNIPERTLQAWENNKRQPPEYVVEFMEYIIEKEGIGLLELVLREEGKEKVLFEGKLDEVVTYLKDNSEVYDWMLAEDPDMKMPELDGIERLKELEYALSDIDLGWWTLEVREL